MWSKRGNIFEKRKVIVGLFSYNIFMLKRYYEQVESVYNCVRSIIYACKLNNTDR